MILVLTSVYGWISIGVMTFLLILFLWLMRKAGKEFCRQLYSIGKELVSQLDSTEEGKAVMEYDPIVRNEVDKMRNDLEIFKLGSEGRFIQVIKHLQRIAKESKEKA